ncbi:hypothetical protein GQ44DRAFT_806153 [Phaeosphaeriaceae sp. PMI808]|nr:hypothetical protein GQ44DRAFT_806153 [Phaeosphaeriaceae sp. PMI808]
MIKQIPDDEMNRQHKERLQQKHIKATQLSFAERTLLQEHNRCAGNGESNELQRSREVKAERAAKETAKEAKKAGKAVKKALREANNAEKEAKKAADEVEEATTGKITRGQKRKRPAAVDAPEPKAMVPRGCEVLEPVGFQMSWWSEE